jgi:26S proteasome regulatory subunit N3
MGEIPPRSLFAVPYPQLLGMGLNRYLELTNSVRQGRLLDFRKVVSQWGTEFKADGLGALIGRLEHTVVKAGLRKVNTSYSKIGLTEVGVRLGLGSAKDGTSEAELRTLSEFVVSKGILDGVVSGTIDHEKGYLQSSSTLDAYSTVAPTEAMHRRIQFCIATHNQAVAGLRYPDESTAYGKMIENVRRAKKGKDEKDGEDGDEGEEKTDEEIAKEIEDEMDEEDGI